MEKCRRMKRQQYLSKNWINSWLWKSSKTRQQYCRLESFAMKTDILKSGSTVKKPHLIKDGIRTDHEDIEESDDCDDGQRQSARKRRSDSICQMDLIVTVMHLEDTPAVLSLGKFCEDHRVFLRVDQWSETTPHWKWQKNQGNTENYVPIVAVLLQSRLDNEWWTVSMECFCCLPGGSECTLNGPVIPFGAMVDFHPISAKDTSRWHQFGPKVLPSILFGYVLYAGRIWKGDIKIADTEELEEMDASEIHARKLNAKEVFNTDERWQFLIPSRGWNSQNSWRRSRLRTSTLIHDRPERGEEQEVFQGESDELSSPKPSSKWLNTRRRGSQKMISGLLRKMSFIAITLNPESNCTFREKNHLLFRWSTSTLPETFIYITGCIVWKTYWRLLERRWRKRIIRCMDKLHKIHFIERKATRRIYIVLGQTDEEMNNLKTRQCVARYVEAYVWCSEKQGKEKMGCRETEAR